MSFLLNALCVVQVLCQTEAVITTEDLSEHVLIRIKTIIVENESKF